MGIVVRDGIAVRTGLVYRTSDSAQEMEFDIGPLDALAYEMGHGATALAAYLRCYQICSFLVQLKICMELRQLLGQQRFL